MSNQNNQPYRTNRNDLQQREIEAHTLLTQSLNLLSDRIQKTESDFISHLKKVEDRLDQIVDLTKSVAVLGQQASQQSDQITELRTSQREHFQKFDASVSRIHTRIEEIQDHGRDKLELIVKETELAQKEVASKCDKATKEISSKADNTEKELKQWLNRGVGAWLVLVLVFGAFNTTLWRWVDSIEKDRTQIVQSMELNKRDHIIYDNRVLSLESTVKDTQEQVKRISQMQQDTDRQLEYLRNRK